MVRYVRMTQNLVNFLFSPFTDEKDYLLVKRYSPEPTSTTSSVSVLLT